MHRVLSRVFGLALLLAIVATPLVAHGTSAQGATPCAALTEMDATAFVTNFVAGWNGHDPDALAAMFDSAAIWHWGIGADAQGTDAISSSLTGFFTAFPGIEITVDRVWLAGDTVIYRYVATGVQETDFMGVPASQTTVTWTGINIMQIECGKIAAFWGEADHFGRITQQGVLPIGSPEAEATPTA